MDENAMVALTGRVFDDAGNVAKTWNDGVPTMLVFSLPVGSKTFTLEVAGQRIEQSIS
ncbi:MAG: hypothetical protein IPK32_23935 [Verrucomicrobiaceae bacterium]|nr:hypothetical protein [Verrucomicrobiaceae bacterium]